jgi:hypothetical protein
MMRAFRLHVLALLSQFAACGGATVDPHDDPSIPFSTRVMGNVTFRSCTGNADCQSPRVCFRLTNAAGICDLPQPMEATTCGHRPPSSPVGPPDECACEGLSCSPGFVCIAEAQLCSCDAPTSNHCVDTACSSPADCSNGTVCRPSSFIVGSGDTGGRCVSPKCHFDSDCTVAPKGWCAVSVNEPPQAGVSTLSAIHCAYPIVDGVCPAGTNMSLDACFAD